MFNSYEKAKEYALRLFEHDLWIFKESENKYHVIRGIAFHHYAYVNQWEPLAQVKLKQEIVEMFTGVIIKDKNEKSL